MGASVGIFVRLLTSGIVSIDLDVSEGCAIAVSCRAAATALSNSSVAPTIVRAISSGDGPQDIKVIAKVRLTTCFKTRILLTGLIKVLAYH